MLLYFLNHFIVLRIPVCELLQSGFPVIDCKSIALGSTNTRVRNVRRNNRNHSV